MSDAREIIDVVKDALSEFVPKRRVDALDTSSRLLTGGVLDSITLVELVAALEDRYGIRFQTHEMSVDHFDSLDDIVEIVQAKTELPL